MKRFFGAVWRIIKSNWILKLMSVLFAVILWSYVLAETNPLRQRELEDISVRYSHTEELEAKGLAISGSLSDVLDNVDVRVEVNQSDLKYLNNKNVFAYIDLSTINGPGEHVLSITAASSYGEVVSVSPSEITLYVDSLDAKPVPVNVVTTGSVPEGYYAIPPVISPDIIYIKGASIDVEKVASAVCSIDLTGLTEEVSQSIDVDLLDKDGNTLDTNMFAGSTLSVILKIDIVAKKTVPIDTSEMLIGQDELAEGYELSGITVDPETVEIIGKKDVLDSIHSIGVSGISVSGASADIKALLDYELPEGVSLLTPGQVQAYISIKEIVDVKTYEKVPVVIKNLPGGLKATLDIDFVDVSVIAGVNQLKTLFKEDIMPYVDLDGLGDGTHKISLKYVLPEGFADENVSSVTKQITVTLAK